MRRNKQKKIFLEGSTKQGFDARKAGELFDLMAYFAGYGFNKSHSAAYALIAYQTAYLKANYLAEFMACLISLEATHADKMSFYLQEAKSSGLGIAPPDINRSLVDFSVCEGGIRFGLHGIKNVGLTAIESIIAEREKNGVYEDLYDFCKRVDLRVCNKRVMENLICAGAFDTLPGSRAQQHAELSHIIDKAIAYKRDKETGQMGLFATAQQLAEQNEPHAFAPLKEWTNRETLEKEKEVIGFYLSAHPMDTYRTQLDWFKPSSFEDTLAAAQQHRGEQEYGATVCGLLKSRKDIVTKKGDRMAFIQIEDGDNSAEVILFPKTFAQVEQWLTDHHVFLIRGAVDITDSSKLKIKAFQMAPIELALQEWPKIQHAIFSFPTPIDEATLSTMQEKLASGTIPASCVFEENGKKLRLSLSKSVALDNDILTELNALGVISRVVL